jgi:hypothetical protein
VLISHLQVLGGARKGGGRHSAGDPRGRSERVGELVHQGDGGGGGQLRMVNALGEHRRCWNRRRETTAVGERASDRAFSYAL